MFEIRKLQQKWCDLTSGPTTVLNPSTFSSELVFICPWISNGIKFILYEMWLWLFNLLFKTFRLQTVWLFNVHTLNQFMSSYGEMRKTKWFNNIFNKYRVSCFHGYWVPCIVYTISMNLDIYQIVVVIEVLNKISSHGTKTGVILYWTLMSAKHFSKSTWKSKLWRTVILWCDLT